MDLILADLTAALAPYAVNEIEAPGPGHSLTVKVGRTSAVVAIAPYREGCGWAVIGHGTLHGEGQIALAGDVAPIVKAVEAWAQTAQPLFA